MIFVAFDEAFEDEEAGWISYLPEALEPIGQEVIISKLKTFEEILPKLKNKRLCFVGHSAGCAFILHVVNKFNLPLDSAIFVAPFLSKADKFDFTKLNKLIPLSYAIYSDNDPYVTIKQSLEFAQKMGCQKIIHRGGGHLGSIFAQGFHLIEELCKTRIESYD